MRNNDINDEDYGKEIPEQGQKEEPWGVQIIGVVMAACVASILVALTLRLDKWLVH